MYYLIDEDGYYIDYVVELPGVTEVDEEYVENEDGEIEETETSAPTPIEVPRHVTVRPPEGMYRPRWMEEASEWVEMKTQEEFEEEEFLQSLIPNAEEIADAEFEIKVLNILTEVELI